MGQKNIKKIFIGIIFLAIAGLCLGVAWNLLRESASSAAIIPPENLPSKIVNEVVDNREKTVEPQSEPARESERSDSIDLAILVKNAQTLYGQEEIDRKEGVLWIDQEQSRFVITLGAVQGLVKGSELSVYNGNKAIGKVKVETLLDVVSYVEPIDIEELMKDNYYNVIIDSR
ncbi:MAG: hypothetical protein H6755_02850 [Candidatus Omnitrophica bacterium]|nr:hypothetical protein [Candidatus Omnitrophota bacterium]